MEDGTWLDLAHWATAEDAKAAAEAFPTTTQVHPRHRHDRRGQTELDSRDVHILETRQTLECCGDAHGLRASRRSDTGLVHPARGTPVRLGCTDSANRCAVPPSRSCGPHAGLTSGPTVVAMTTSSPFNLMPALACLPDRWCGVAVRRCSWR